MYAASFLCCCNTEIRLASILLIYYGLLRQKSSRQYLSGQSRKKYISIQIEKSTQRRIDRVSLEYEV